MFLIWAQQWQYIARTLELGYRVLRTDTDVYLAEELVPHPVVATAIRRLRWWATNHPSPSVFDTPSPSGL